MARPVSGAVKVSIVRVKQKNGDVYVYERKRRYDPEVGYTRTFDCRLMGKIPAGKEAVVPTRSRRRPATAVDQPSQETPDLLAWIGRASGLDADLRHSLDDAKASAVIAVVRFMASNPGRALSGLPAWQQREAASCCDELLTDERRLALLSALSADGLGREVFFRCRAERFGDEPLLALVATAAPTAPDDESLVKTDDRRLIFCAKTSGQPVAVEPLSSVLTEEASLARVTKRVGRRYLLVTDGGLESEAAIDRLAASESPFLSEVSKRQPWALEALEANADALRLPEAIPENLSLPHGLSVPFVWKNGRTLWLQLYYSRRQAADDEARLCHRLQALKETLEAGAEALLPASQRLADEFLEVVQKGRRTDVTFRKDAWARERQLFGIEALLASDKSNPWEALAASQLRSFVEDFLQDTALTAGLDGGDHRESADFLRTAALGYRLWLMAAVTRVVSQLSTIGTRLADVAAPVRKALLQQLREETIDEILDRFDGSRPLAEMTELDQCFWRLLAESDGA